MSSLTLRDIPEELLSKIRVLSERERRSLNKEILVVLEEGVYAHTAQGESSEGPPISPEIQTKIWEELSGKWEDSRRTEEIIGDIRAARTQGREVAF